MEDLKSLVDKEEDDAYDPWPGCTMDKTGSHCSSHYYDKHRMNEKFNKFFGLKNDELLSFSNLDDIVIAYVEKNNGLRDTIINYDELLWDLFLIDKNKTFKLYEIEKYVELFIVSSIYDK